jgi:hypothetical protein
VLEKLAQNGILSLAGKGNNGHFAPFAWAA